MGKETEINIKALHKLVDKPYKYGELDCLKILQIVYGNRLPQEYNGVSVDNYTEIFDDPVEAGKFLIEAIKYYFKPKRYPIIGDVVIIEKRNFHLLGIYTGNQTMLTAISDLGIKTIPIMLQASYWRLE